MPDFVGTYQLAVDPPAPWDTQLRALASAAGLEVRSTSRVAHRLTIVIRVPKSASAPASELAGSFFADVVSVLSEDPTVSGRAQLVSTLLAKSRTEVVLSMLRSIATWGLLLAVPIVLGSALMSGLRGMFGTIGIGIGSFFISFLIGLIAHFGRTIRQEFAAKTEKEQQAVHERALVQQVAGEEDPKLRARLELARISLRSRASSMRGDADRLWRRSLWAYRGAFVFFVMAIAGPGVAAALLLKSTNPDWHFMFGNRSPHWLG